jgi:hypothetical protein
MDGKEYVANGSTPARIAQALRCDAIECCGALEGKTRLGSGER